MTSLSHGLTICICQYDKDGGFGFDMSIMVYCTGVRCRTVWSLAVALTLSGCAVGRPAFASGCAVMLLRCRPGGRTVVGRGMAL